MMEFLFSGQFLSKSPFIFSRATAVPPRFALVDSPGTAQPEQGSPRSDPFCPPPGFPPTLLQPLWAIQNDLRSPRRVQNANFFFNFVPPVALPDLPESRLPGTLRTPPRLPPFEGRTPRYPGIGPSHPLLQPSLSPRNSPLCPFERKGDPLSGTYFKVSLLIRMRPR